MIKKNHLFGLLLGMLGFSLIPNLVISNQPVLLLTQTHLTQSELEKLGQKLAQQYLNKTPIQEFPNDLTLAKAQIVQNSFVKSLQPFLGNVVGYKAGLTNQAVQKRFNVSHPLQGVLLEKMLVQSGAKVPLNFGTQPRIEGDLIVRVGSDRINTAKTPEEVISCLDAVIPFIELPDLIFSKDLKLTASHLLATNVGSRMGVMGQPIPIKDAQKWQKQLSQVQVMILDEKDTILGQGDSMALLGDPLKVVIWLRDTLQLQGKSLKKGDLLSLGSITPVLPLQSAQTLRIKYIGLSDDRPIELSVQFVKP
jgi:2-keto-4-pentenoate hydratase